MSELAAIEKRRIELGLSVDGLCRAAGIAVRGYRYALGGAVTPRLGTCARLKLALQRLRLRQALETDDDWVLAIAYRMAVALAAQATGRDARRVHGQAPGRRATQSAAWMEAAETRRLAVYVMNVGCGFNQAQVARAAGMTRQAVSLACRELEEKRDDPQFEALVDTLVEAIMGEW